MSQETTIAQRDAERARNERREAEPCASAAPARPCRWPGRRGRRARSRRSGARAPLSIAVAPRRRRAPRSYRQRLLPNRLARGRARLATCQIASSRRARGEQRVELLVAALHDRIELGQRRIGIAGMAHHEMAGPARGEEAGQLAFVGDVEVERRRRRQSRGWSGSPAARTFWPKPRDSDVDRESFVRHDPPLAGSPPGCRRDRGPAGDGRDTPADRTSSRAWRTRGRACTC